MIRQLVAAYARARVPPQRGQQGRPPRQLAPARALLVLPYVSIVSEKAAHLERVLAPLRGARVKGYSGSEVAGTPLSSPVRRGFGGGGELGYGHTVGWERGGLGVDVTCRFRVCEESTHHQCGSRGYGRKRVLASMCVVATSREVGKGAGAAAKFLLEAQPSTCRLRAGPPAWPVLHMPSACPPPWAPGDADG